MFGQDNNNNNKAVAQNEVATKGAFDSLNETIFRNHHYFFDNKPCIAARFRRHGSDLHASCGESLDLVFSLKYCISIKHFSKIIYWKLKIKN